MTPPTPATYSTSSIRAKDTAPTDARTAAVDRGTRQKDGPMNCDMPVPHHHATATRVSARSRATAVKRAIAITTMVAIASFALPASAQAPAADAKSATTPAKAATPDRRAALRRIRNWGYQLKRISKHAVAASPFDLMVIDYAPDRISGREEPFTRAELAAMQSKPGGGRRLVFAYLSIGEAERYRTYWHQSWYANPPSWLGRENPQWPGNYPVRFWDPAWQSLIFGTPGAYLDRILAAGFDGIYIDRADIADHWLPSRPRARDEMARLIVRMSAYARRKRGDVLILMQNAEELLERRAVVDAIDGVAKEDLFYGINHDQSANPKGDVQASVDLLQRLKRRGKSVLVVEYLPHGSDKADDVVRRARGLGYVPLVAGRALDVMPAPVR